MAGRRSRSQVFYPDEYNGAFAACPDPIDFRAYMLVDIYSDTNAYLSKAPSAASNARAAATGSAISRDGARRRPVGARARHQEPLGPAVRYLGGGLLASRRRRLPEDDLGQDDRRDRSRGGGALAGELRPALYPRARLGDLGPKLEGKIHIFTGDMDNYYLNNAVYLTEEFLESTTEPYYAGVVDYGDRAEHCWNGDHENGNHISRLRYNTMYLPRILERIEAAAPEGADLKSWRY